MRRRDFLKTTGTSALALGVFPHLAYKALGENNSPNSWNFIGFLIPTLIDKGIDLMFKTFMDDNDSSVTSSIVQKGLININNGNFHVSNGYKYFYDNIVRPKVNKRALNGVGYYGTDKNMQEVLNSFDGFSATTPVHCVRELSTFNEQTWARYCDLADLQTSEYSDKIFVTPRDSRPDKIKETVWIPKKYAYFLYNPKFYCYGLPTENPQYKRVTESLQRAIKEKTGKTSSSSYYYTQTYCFMGNSICKEPQEDYTTIYWDHDSVIREYFNLKTTKPCGDPTIECDGDSPTKPIITKP
ncbi:MAG: twin-arginine translocation signal domain-containing protein [Bacteroidota bacterium]